MSNVKRIFVLLVLVYVCLLDLRVWLEAGMTTHMGVLIPSLIICISLVLLRIWPRVAEWGRRYRYSLIWFVLFSMMLWMLPRLLDASLYEPMVSVLKWLTLPLVGMALVLCWRHLPWLLRAVLHLEAIATLLRLGWLYMAAPQEYCISYGIDDQNRLGYLLLIYAVVYGGILGLRVMFVDNNNLSRYRIGIFANCD
ncbi:MAG: hypothetical protein P8Z75_02665 [Gammaproteobacteria bacterium]